MRKNKGYPKNSSNKPLASSTGQQPGGRGSEGIGHGPMPSSPISSPTSATYPSPSPLFSEPASPKDPASLLNSVDASSLSQQVTSRVQASPPKVRVPKGSIVHCKACLRMIGHFTKDLHRKEPLDLSFIYLTLHPSKKVDQRKWSCPQCGTPFLDSVGAISTDKGWL
jgi:hypothetical protein